MKIPRGRPADWLVKVLSLSTEWLDDGSAQLTAARVQASLEGGEYQFLVYQYDLTQGWEHAQAVCGLDIPVHMRVSAGYRLVHTVAPPGTSKEDFQNLADEDSAKRVQAHMGAAQKTYYEKNKNKVLMAQRIKRLRSTGGIKSESDS